MRPRARVGSRCARAAISWGPPTITCRCVGSSSCRYGAAWLCCHITCGGWIGRACGVRVETVPWGIGKHQLTKAYMLFLAHWARKLSWQETAVSFRTSWDKVCQSVEYVVQWGLDHRQLGPIVAIGVDEIQYAKGHKYLDSGLPDRAALHAPAMDRPGADGGELRTSSSP